MSTVWGISSDEFDASWSIEEKIGFFLRYAILAPSAHNTQPWSCKIEDNQLHVLRDAAHTLGPGDPTLRQTFLGIGAFIETFVIAANRFGYAVEIENVPLHTRDTHVATLVLGETGSASQSNSELFDAIVKRHTNRGLYNESALNPEITDSLRRTSDEPGTAHFLIDDEEARKRIGALVGRGVAIGLTLPPLKEELSELVSYASEARDTGLVVEAMISPTSDGSDTRAKALDPAEESGKSEEKFAKAPLLVVVASEQEGTAAWISAGRTLQRILLTAAHLGLAHCISAAPVEVPPLVPQLRREIDPRLRPQALVRLGYPLVPELTLHSGRRQAASILLT